MTARTRRKRVPAATAAHAALGVVRDGNAQLRLRPRLYRGGDIALGPGKVELLAAVARTGSIRQAAVELDMSYMRAWTLVRTMNACFATPLVIAARGGRGGGVARLTPSGERVLELYHTLAAAGVRAAAPSWNKLRKLLRP